MTISSVLKLQETLSQMGHLKFYHGYPGWMGIVLIHMLLCEREAAKLVKQSSDERALSRGEVKHKEEVALWEQGPGEQKCSGQGRAPAAVLRWCSPRVDGQFTSWPVPLPALTSAFLSLLRDDIPVHPSDCASFSLKWKEVDLTHRIMCYCDTKMIDS